MPVFNSELLLESSGFNWFAFNSLGFPNPVLAENPESLRTAWISWVISQRIGPGFAASACPSFHRRHIEDISKFHAEILSVGNVSLIGDWLYLLDHLHWQKTSENTPVDTISYSIYTWNLDFSYLMEYGWNVPSKIFQVYVETHKASGWFSAWSMAPLAAHGILGQGLSIRQKSGVSSDIRYIHEIGCEK